ncbi:MAG: DNA-binding protein, partial [Gammaproteobacteria bacterium]|nr:DNA-binding protein [Gammaproteobacteria bacterium]
MTQGITYQDVANAAIGLLEQKQHPTLDRIREFLGTGSKSTIARHFRAWKSKHGEASNSEDIPHELITPLKELWNQVIAKGDQRIEKVELDAQQEIEQLRQQLNVSEKNYLELLSSHHQLGEKFHHQVRQTEQSQQAFDAEKLTHEKLKVSYEALAQQRDEQKDEATRLHQLLNHVQSNLEHYQTAMQKLREEQTLEAEKQKTMYERNIAELKQEIVHLSDKANQFQRERDQLANQLDHKTKQCDSITAEKSSLQQQLQDKTITETTLQHRYHDLQQLCN